tara:strand:+ start:3523 stop:3930 length:408 start_codon:yes stop_codon:yes gene_type:complete
MAATFQYKVFSLKTDPNDDNYITEATLEIFGTEGSVVKASTCHCVFPGSKLAVGSDFKSLDDLKKAEGEATIVSWVKAGWGDDKCKKLEGFIQQQIDIHNKKAVISELESKDTSYSASPTVTPEIGVTPGEEAAT